MKDKVVQKKLMSVGLLLVALVVLYMTIGTGNETYIWGGLGFMAVASAVLYMNT